MQAILATSYSFKECNFSCLFHLATSSKLHMAPGVLKLMAHHPVYRAVSSRDQNYVIKLCNGTLDRRLFHQVSTNHSNQNNSSDTEVEQ